MPAVLVNPICTSSGLAGYQVTYSNGTVKAFIIGVNATAPPPTFATGFVALDYVLAVIAFTLLLATATYIVANFSRRIAIALIVVNLAVAAVAGAYASNPLRPLTIHCPSGTVTAFVVDPALPIAYMAFLISLINLVVFSVAILLRYGGWL